MVGVTVVSKGWQVPSLVVLPVGPSVFFFVDDVGSVPAVKRHTISTVFVLVFVCFLMPTGHANNNINNNKEKKGVN